MRTLSLLLLLACRGPQETSAEPSSDASSVRDALYFVLVDRYANGDPSNDETTSPDDPSGWHGGDLAGVYQHLDDIQDLGVGGVWLSPISATRTEPFNGWGAFHGYWTRDLGDIEPRFGSFDDARRLSAALHERGLKLLLDMVYNHVGYDTPRTRSHPDWFHDNGDIVDWENPEQKVTHDVHGLPDLAQENPEVYLHLLEASRRWIREVQPDGFRIDAVGHLPSAFLRQLGADLRAEAGPSFALLGEYFDGDPYRLAERFSADGFTSIFDFPLHYAMVDVFCRGAHTGRIAATLSDDRAYTLPAGPFAAELRPRVTFLDNHDVPRIASQCGGNLDRVSLALAFQLTTRGTPALYQGIEHGAQGDKDPANRADMRFVEHELKALIRDLLDLRAKQPSLHSGRVVLDEVGPTHLVYRRIGQDDETLIVVNLDDEAMALSERERRFTRGADAAHQITQRSMRALAARTDRVPKHSVTLWTAPASSTLERAQQAVQAKWLVRVEDAPPELIPHLRLVGSGPETGRWNPSNGVIASPTDPLRFTFDAPSDAVFAVKLIAVMPDGDVRWSKRTDRYLFTPTSDSFVVSW